MPWFQWGIKRCFLTILSGKLLMNSGTSFFLRNSTNTDTHTRIITHPYKHTMTFVQLTKLLFLLTEHFLQVHEYMNVHKSMLNNKMPSQIKKAENLRSQKEVMRPGDPICSLFPPICYSCCSHSVSSFFFIPCRLPCFCVFVVVVVFFRGSVSGTCVSSSVP
jgi:hypothetical protein